MRIFLLLLMLAPGCALSAQTRADSPATAASGPCPRYAVGSTLVEPKDLFSSHGLLRLELTYQTRVDSAGNKLFCYTTPDGAQSPTLHVHPGDELVISL